MDTNGSGATLYYTKRFVSGLLAGLDYPTSSRFPSDAAAAQWARAHRVVPVKPSIGGTAYLVVDPTFQSVAR